MHLTFCSLYVHTRWHTWFSLDSKCNVGCFPFEWCEAVWSVLLIMSMSIRGILYSSGSSIFRHQIYSLSPMSSGPCFFPICTELLGIFFCLFGSYFDTFIMREKKISSHSLKLTSQIQYSFHAFKSFHDDVQFIYNGARWSIWFDDSTILIFSVCVFHLAISSIENTLMYIYFFRNSFSNGSWSLVYILYPIPLVYLVAIFAFCWMVCVCVFFEWQLFMWVVVSLAEKRNEEKKYR